SLRQLFAWRLIEWLARARGHGQRRRHQREEIRTLKLLSGGRCTPAHGADPPGADSAEWHRCAKGGGAKLWGFHGLWAQDESAGSQRPVGDPRQMSDRCLWSRSPRRRGGLEQQVGPAMSPTSGKGKERRGLGIERGGQILCEGACERAAGMLTGGDLGDPQC